MQRYREGLLCVVSILASLLIAPRAMAGDHIDGLDYAQSMKLASASLNRCWDARFDVGMAALNQAIKLARRDYPKCDARTREALRMRASNMARFGKDNDSSIADF